VRRESGRRMRIYLVWVGRVWWFEFNYKKFEMGRVELQMLRVWVHRGGAHVQSNVAAVASWNLIVSFSNFHL